MSILYREENATVYTSDRSKNLYISYYNQNEKRIQKSAKTSDLNEAIKILKKHLITTEMIKSNEFKVIESKKTSIMGICKYLKITINKIEGYKNYKSTIRHLDKIANAIGDINIEDLTKQDLMIIYNKEMSKTVINNFNKCINMIIEYALEKRLITTEIKIPKPSIKKAIKRFAMTREKIEEIIHKYANESESMKSKIAKENAYINANLIHFLLLTGIRLGEARYLKHKDVRRNVETNKFEVILKISKTAARKINITDDAFLIIMFLHSYKKAINPNVTDEFYVFARADNTIFDYTNRLKDYKSRNREYFKEINAEDFTIYHARHSFIEQKIREEKDIFKLAKHCGTSIEMIQKHYAHAFNVTEQNYIYNDDDFFFSEV